MKRHAVMSLKIFFFVMLLIFTQKLVCAQSSQKFTDSWAQVKKNGQGYITAYWYESKPFISRTAAGMTGIEYEILEGFRKFIKNKYHCDLRIIWKEARSFGDTFTSINDVQKEGTIGVSAFSITPERKKSVGFSPAYMSDISVLITSKNIPIVQSQEEFNRILSKLTAVTIVETTYEQDLLKLRHEGDIPFNIDYIPSSENILRAVAARDSAFGFIDLPVYLMMFNEDPSINVQRQNMYPVKREGYAVIYPKESDWALPVHEYFSSKDFSSRLETIISHYIDPELYHFTESLAIQSNDMLVLLMKEKEIQSKTLAGKTEQIAKEAKARNFLIALIAIIFIFLIAIIMLYRKRSQQKKKIESQRRSIQLKNEQLEKRNLHLVTLDDEKNNLIKILAHDLRTPINHVQGLAQVFLLSNDSLTEDQKLIIERINDASVRLNKMISNILDIDSIENNRVNIFMDTVSVSSLITQVVKSFDKEAARKNITLAAICNTDNGKIKGDSLFLTQVLENLISNALKFSEKGKKIEVSARENGMKVMISVKDSGPGLTEEDLKMLFKKFQRLSAKPTNGENSTGLGLSIVKKYVELMGGQVWCESQPGHGAMFIVEFNKA